MRGKILYSVFLTIAALLICLAIVTLSATIKNIILTDRVKAFISSATYEGDYNDKVKLYSVDLGLEEASIKIEENTIILGDSGDYFIMPESRSFDFDYLRAFLSYSFGGHAGLIGYDDGVPTLMEAMGATLDQSFVFHNQGVDFDLYEPENRTIIGYRVNLSKAEREKAFNYALFLEGADYNYFYVVSIKNKYYCTDLVSRSYSEAGLDVDLRGPNFLYVSTQDLALNNYSYITYFKYVDSDGIMHIYYAK